MSAAFDLRKLYHPGGFPVAGSELTDRKGKVVRDHSCPCGCAPAWTRVGPERLGIAGTPGMLAIARWEKARRRLPKSGKVAKPWRRAVVSVETVEMLDVENDREGEPKPCTDQDCPRQHVERDGRGLLAGRFHTASMAVRVYRLPNGAVARVRADRGLRL